MKAINFLFFWINNKKKALNLWLLNIIHFISGIHNNFFNKRYWKIYITIQVFCLVFTSKPLMKIIANFNLILNYEIAKTNMILTYITTELLQIKKTIKIKNLKFYPFMYNINTLGLLLYSCQLLDFRLI